MKIKICGITNLEDAKIAAGLGVDILGFIIYPDSPRYISLEDAEAIISKLPASVLKAGVFVNEGLGKLKDITKQGIFDIIQLHGYETPIYCDEIKGVELWKAFRIASKDDLEGIKVYDVDGYLLDTYKEGVFGGTGKVFNWELANEAKTIVDKIILSGGINISNVGEAITRVKPYCIDINSSIESSPGKKDHAKLEEIVKIIR